MKFAVILSGCGNLDGSEIHESVSILLAIDKAGATYQCFAPNIEQHHVINFVSKTETAEKRNVLVEAARIARGDIKDIKEFEASEFDALMLPGGFGAAKNLSTFAFAGADMQVNKEVEKAILSMLKAEKPIGAICIAPIILAKVIKGAKLTLGNDKATIEIAEKLGANHQITQTGQIAIDEMNKIVTAPCYMLNATIKDIADEAQKVVNRIVKFINK